MGLPLRGGEGSVLLCKRYFQRQSQSYITTDRQSANLSSSQAPSEAQDQVFVTVSCGFVDVGRPL
jgi:hypothetical protein